MFIEIVIRDVSWLNASLMTYIRDASWQHVSLMTHIRCVLTRSVSNVNISQTRKFASVMCCYHRRNVSDAFFSVTNNCLDVSLMRRFHIVHIDPGCYTVRTKLLIFHVHFVVCTRTHKLIISDANKEHRVPVLLLPCVLLSKPNSNITP